MRWFDLVGRSFFGRVEVQLHIKFEVLAFQEEMRLRT
jgi:hypothetical protein